MLADHLRRLIARWREKAAELRRHPTLHVYGHGLEEAARELEEVLRFEDGALH